MKFYIACSLSRYREHRIIRDALHATGHEITVDWTTEPPWVEELEHGIGGSDARTQVAAVRHAGANDTKGVHDADIVIVLVGGGSGRGTHVELGLAIAYGKPVILVGTDKDIWGEGGRGSYTCAFYHVANVHHLFKGGVHIPAYIPVILEMMKELVKPPRRPSRGVNCTCELPYPASDGCCNNCGRPLR